GPPPGDSPTDEVSRTRQTGGVHGPALPRHSLRDALLQSARVGQIDGTGARWPGPATLGGPGGVGRLCHLCCARYDAGVDVLLRRCNNPRSGVAPGKRGQETPVSTGQDAPRPDWLAEKFRGTVPNRKLRT